MKIAKITLSKGINVLKCQSLNSSLTYAKLVDASSDYQKSLIKIVDKLLDKKSKNIIPTHTDPLKLANEFNDYYFKKIM